ncbi:Uncharacterised protein [uncultured archaeon]|nr:Uncharacterised protein [uncultured archaeon]
MRALSIAFLFILSIALLVSLGCVQKPETTVNEPPAVVPANNITNATVAPSSPCSSGNIVQKDDCFAALAASKRDASICTNIYDVGKLDSCYALFANIDLETCKKISDATMRADCLTENAKRMKSQDACSLIGAEDKKAACLKSVLPECMQIIEPEKRDLCLALEKNDYTQCKEDWCFMRYALNRSDGNACALITSPTDEYTCKAIVKNDVGECKKASLEAIQDVCIKNASIALGNQDGCDLATEGSTYRNSCYLYFAVKSQDSSICAKAYPEFTLMIGSSRNWCYQQYANQTADASVCPKVTETINRITCYRDAAIQNRMPSLCNGLWTEAMKGDCYAATILYDQRGPVATDCQNVPSLDWKDKCFYRVAYVTYNQTYCSFVRDGTPDRASCDALFGS